MHIRSELQRNGIAYRDDREWFRTVCPHPHPGDGVNTKFNFGISKDGKSCFCFVCGKHGSWQKNAGIMGCSKFGLKGYIGDDAIDFNFAEALKLRMVQSALNDDVVVHDLPDNRTPWEGSWRGMSEAFLRSMSAHAWNQCRRTEDGRIHWTQRIWFPVVQWGSYAGYFGRRLDSVDIMRYYNAPWMKSSEVLFGFDAARSFHPKRVVVVEGPVDALKLLSHGVPAMSVMGVQNIEKEQLLVAAGIEKVYVLFDADAAGQKYGPMFRDRCSSFMDTELLECPENRGDPGEFDANDCAYLRHLVMGS